MTLRMRIAAHFILFTVIVSALLWLMEVVLFERLYYDAKTRETKAIAADLAVSCANDTTEDFSVYDGKRRLAFQRDVMNNGCLLHGHDNMLFTFIQALDSSSDGTICQRVYDEQIGMETLVVGCLIHVDDETQGVILLNTILEPVDSTVAMLKRFVLLFTVMVMVIGCVIAIVLANRLSAPIVRITASAKRMARGDYHTRFEGSSCREVDELARALTYAEHEISRADSMQRDLVANVSHDLRTPLTMLKAYAEMIRDLSGDNPVKRNAHLQVIIDETDRLAALVNDILDLSRLESGSQKPEMQEIDVTSWLTDIIARYKGVSEQMGYHITFTPDAPCTVTCDPAKLERAVCNLINNAINYTGEDKQVFVRQVNTADGVRIEVQDTGNGIEEDKIKLIFDKYYRSEHHTREVVGTGLGLSIVKAILKLHGYSYGVRSRVGEGSIFWFLIKK